jgi:glycosyltransferase involved in cell wall biosynthesis
MRIAQVSATFPPYAGGTGNVCYHNARLLASRGHDVCVLTARWPGPAADPEGVAVRRYRPLARIGNAPLLPRLLRERAFDLIHLHYPFYFGAELVALTGVPCVVTYHHDVALPGAIGLATRVHQRLIGLRLLRRARRLFATTLDYFDHSTVAGLRRVPGSRVVELPNGVETARFVPGSVDLATRRRHRVPDDAFVVLFVGGLDRPHAFKGVPTLLAALARVPDAWCLIAGDGDLRGSYERMARQAGLAERARFVGSVPDDALPRLYRAADVVVLPSETRGEAFGLVLLEAMASGRSVIASDLPGVRTLVVDGVTGRLVPPRDPVSLASVIAELRGCDDRRVAMGAAGRSRVEQRYDWERIGDRLDQECRDVWREARLDGR